MSIIKDISPLNDNAQKLFILVYFGVFVYFGLFWFILVYFDIC